MNQIVNVVQVVAVRFQATLGEDRNDRTKGYDYRTRLDLKPGDVAVVEVNGLLKCVDVMEVKASTHFTGGVESLKWIVDKVEVQEYLDRLAAEVQIQRELDELTRLVNEQRKLMKVREGLSTDPELVKRFDALMARKHQL